MNYKTVERHADANKCSVATAMRHLCAVPVEWSSWTMLVQVKTRSPLSAYIGRGNIATATSKFNVRSTIDPSAYSNGPVEQLYIPGLSSPDLRKASVFIEGTLMQPLGTSVQGYLPERQLVR